MLLGFGELAAICFGRGLSDPGFAGNWDFRDGGGGAAERGDGSRRRAGGLLARRVDSVCPARENFLAYGCSCEVAKSRMKRIGLAANDWDSETIRIASELRDSSSPAT